MSQVSGKTTGTTSSFPSEAVAALLERVDVAAVQAGASEELGRLLAKEAIQRPEVPIVDGVMTPTTIGQTRRLAEVILAGGMMPRGWALPNDSAQAVLAKATIALAFAYRLRRDWTWALGAVAVVNNRPCLYGDALPDLIWASGKCAVIDETWEGLSGDGMAGPNTVAVCRAKRSDNGAEKVYRFSVKDAQNADLFGKSGPWRSYPKRMLQMRARAFCLRDLFADVLSGAGVAEEQQDTEEASRNAANAEGRAAIAARIDQLRGDPEPSTGTTEATKAPEPSGDVPPPVATPEQAAATVASLGVKLQADPSIFGEGDGPVGTTHGRKR